MRPQRAASSPLSAVFLLGAMAALALSGCRTQFDRLLLSGDIGEKYRGAMAYFNQHEYRKAAQLFESLSIYTGGMPQDDTVQYYWGLSNYRMGNFYSAEPNFAKFTETYPTSPFAPDAAYYRLDCMYRSSNRHELDQAQSKACLAAIKEYRHEYHPDSVRTATCDRMRDDLQHRLDRKAYEAGKLYYGMEDYVASRVKLQNILKDNADNCYREDILYYIAMSSYHYARLSVPAKQRERYLSFADDYLNFVSEYPSSHYRNTLEGHYRRVQKILGRGADGKPTSQEDQ